MDDITRVALYARVSSEKQADEMTIRSQVAALRERIAADGCRIDAECCFLDDGFSGTTLQRPALERLRDLAYSGAIDRLYVHSPDRLARHYAYQVVLLEELQKHQVEVVFLDGVGSGGSRVAALRIAGRELVGADARHDRRVRTGQDFGADAAWPTLCRSPGKSERIGNTRRSVIATCSSMRGRARRVTKYP